MPGKRWKAYEACGKRQKKRRRVREEIQYINMSSSTEKNSVQLLETIVTDNETPDSSTVNPDSPIRAEIISNTSNHNKLFCETNVSGFRRNRFSDIKNNSSEDSEQPEHASEINSDTDRDMNIDENIPSSPNCSSINLGLSVSENNSVNDILNFQSETQSNREEELLIFLKQWVSDEKTVPRTSTTRLLNGIHRIFPSIPSDARTLLKHKFNNKYVEIDDMQYIHISKWFDDVQDYLKTIIPIFNSNHGQDEVEENQIIPLSFCFFIDGIPIFDKSPFFHIYPILLCVKEYPQKIFSAGVFCKNKSNYKGLVHPDKFLKHLCDDLKIIISQILEIGNKLYQFKMTGPWICDAPCRADMKQIILHSGYNSCERCTVHGSYHGGHVCLEDVNCNPRSDATFFERDHQAHHKDHNIMMIERLNIGMVSQFILDIMHLIYLGVTKRLLKRWINSPKNNKIAQISSNSVNILSEQIDNCSQYMPLEFRRKFQYGLSRLSYWKATEYRAFLLYAGPVILKDKKIIPSKYYEHFLKLSVAARLLETNNQYHKLSYIRRLLREFVSESKTLYGLEFITYNVHSLIHLPDDYEQYGSLSNLNAFPFESFLGEIKKSVRSPYKSSKQVEKFMTNQNQNINAAKFREKSFTFKLKRKSTAERVECESITINNHKIIPAEEPLPNNCIETINGNIAMVSKIFKINNELLLQVQNFSPKMDYFESPVKSCEIGLFIMKDLENGHHIIKKSAVIDKCLLFKHKNKFLSVKYIN